MRLNDMTLIGWLHTVFCFVALYAGGRNLLRRKGTASHKRMGQIYVAAMVLQNTSALLVYEPHGLSGGRLALDHFGIFHWLAIATLIIVAIGYYAAARQSRVSFAYIHPIMMILSYYLLLGGAVNEVFVRVGVLYGLPGRSVLVNITQSVSMFACFGVLTYYIGKIAGYRERFQSNAGEPEKPPSPSSAAAA